MSIFVVSFFAALACSMALVPLCKLVARRYGYVALPKADRWHRRPTPMFGGVAIALTLFICIGILGGVRFHAVLLACGAVIFGVGLTDDILTLKPSTKLVAQIAVASVLLSFGYRLGWAHSLTVDSLLTIAWIIGITNAFNLLDNMDGLAGGIALIAGSALLVNLLPLEPGIVNELRVSYVAVLLGAVAGFLVYNYHPASIFMGDSGSLFIGLNLAALTLTSPAQLNTGSRLLPIVVAPLLVLLVPIFDTTLVTVLRTLSGKAPSVGGRDHSSHRLVAIGLSERSAVLALWTLAAAAGALGVAMQHVREDWVSLLAVVFLLAMAIFAVYLARVRVYDDPDALLRQGHITPVVAEFFYKRRVAEVALDFCLVSIAYYAAYRLRFEGAQLYISFTYFLTSLPVVLATQMVALFAVGAYRGVWRYFGLMDAVVFARAVAYGTIGSVLIIVAAFRFEGYSRTVFVTHAAILLPMLVGSRASFRLISEFVTRRRSGLRLIIYGAGDGGVLALRELLNDQQTSYHMLGFIDDDPQKRRMRLHGYSVLGDYAHLQSLALERGTDIIVISSSKIETRRLLELEQMCFERGITLARFQLGLQDLTVPGPRPVTRTGERSVS